MSNVVIAEFRDSGDRFVEIAKSISSEKLHKSPQNDEWSPANIIHHMADSEAHFYIRYLRVLTENLPTTEFLMKMCIQNFCNMKSVMCMRLLR